MTSRIAWLVALIVLIPTTTLSAGEKALSRIAFGSCAREDRPQPIWDAVVASHPQLFLSLGDNIYGDSKDMTVLKEKYAKLAAMPGYQKLLKSCPLLATWDDHDYGANDAGAEYPMKDESQQIFLDFYGIPKDSPRRTQKGVYISAMFGPPDRRIQVILLDTRYFRSPLKKKTGKLARDEGPYLVGTEANATILGPAQWQWLEQQLKVPAKLRLLCSSIQVVAQDHGWEKWENFPLERARLYKLIADTQAAGIVILSGDRHLAELSVMDAGVGYPLYDLTSSGLTEGSKRWRRLESNRHRLATMNWGNNFGVVTVDWERPDPLVSLQIHDQAGDTMIQEKLPLSLLQPGSLKAKTSDAIARVNGKALTPELVKELVGKDVTVEMRVVGTGAAASNGLVFLNSAEDRANDDNLTVVLDKKVQEKLRQAGVTNARTHFDGQPIHVTGTLSLFRDRPQIMVSDAAQIKIAE